MEYVFLIMLVPIIVGIIAKYFFKYQITWPEVVLQIAVVGIITTGTWYAGKYYELSFTEILNGEITEKHRDHGTYIETYSCNCTTRCTGSGSSRSCYQSCQTCTRLHYTVKWWLSTTIGDITIDYIDSTFSSVYSTPDPIEYKNAYVGEPCSKNNRYINYVKAANKSLYYKELEDDISLPNYPSIYGKYKVNPVIFWGDIKSDISVWNAELREKVKKLGPKKQVNIIMVLTDNKSSDFIKMLENHWMGGNGNDVVVVIGVDGKDIIWADAFTFAENYGNELLVSSLSSGLNDIKTIEDPEFIIGFVTNTIDELFDRKPMEEFKYLESEVLPSPFMIFVAVLLSILSSIGMIYVNYKYDVFGEIRKYFA